MGRSQNSETERELQISGDFVVGMVFCLIMSLVGVVLVWSTIETEPSIPIRILSVPFAFFIPVLVGFKAYEDRPRRVVARQVAFDFGAPTPERIQSLLDFGRSEQAEMGARALVQSDPANSAGWEILARSLLNQGRRKAATGAAIRALSIDPMSIDALQVRALSRQGRGRHQNALSDLNTALRIAPENTVLLADLAAQHLKLAGPQWLKGWARPQSMTEHIHLAAEAVDFVLKSDPTDLRSLRLWSQIQLMLGETAQAKKAAITAVSAAPDDARALYDLGCALLREDDIEAGVECLVAATTRNPAYVPFVAQQLHFSSRSPIYWTMAIIGGNSLAVFSVVWIGNGFLALLGLVVGVGALIESDRREGQTSDRIPDHLRDVVGQIRREFHPMKKS